MMDAMHEAQVARLSRLLDLRKAELDALEQQVDLTRRKNRRYNIDINVPFFDDNVDATDEPLAVLSQAITVASGTRFFCKSIEQSVSIVSEGAAFALGPIAAGFYLGFEWKVRDTGSDRAWQNRWLPQEMLYSGDVRGLQFGDSHAVVSGGADIIAEIKVFRSINGPTGAALFDVVEGFVLQMSFAGIEVPE